MNYYQNKIFHNISYDEYTAMRNCLSARELSFHAGDTICQFGEAQKQVGILSNGSASTIRYEPNGSRTILERLGPHDIFGEILSFQSTLFESTFVICDTDCQVMFFDYDHILRPCAKSCSSHHEMIQNMLQIISEKVLLLGERVDVLSKRSIREKLLCYFHRLSEKSDSSEILLPFTMVDLADYLSVDRSAMSRELKKMKEDGLISIQHKTISLLS